MDYTFFNSSRTPDDFTSIQRDNIKFSNYLLDNPLTSHSNSQSALLFASQQHFVPRFTIHGSPSTQFIDHDSSLKHFILDIAPTPSFSRFGATTPFLISSLPYLQHTDITPANEFRKNKTEHNNI